MQSPFAPSSRARPYELLLLPGAAGLRGALHEVAALIGYPPDPDCLTDRHTPPAGARERPDEPELEERCPRFAELIRQ